MARQETTAGESASPLAQPGNSTNAAQVDATVGSPAALTGSAATAQSPPTGGGAPVLSYSAHLGEAIQTVRETIELASRQGISQARIALQPEELGDIRIHLTQTSDGLLVRVTADSDAGAQALAAGHAELRQSLSSLDLPLSRLHIGRSEQSGANPQDHRGSGSQAAGRDSASGPGGRRASGSGASGGEWDGDQGGEVASDLPAAALPQEEGALVDVLA